jgi:hypothetical protein
MKHLYWGPNPSAPYASTRSDEIMATLGANIRVPPWPPPFTIRGGHGGVAVWKINLSRGRLKCKKGRMMRTSLLWIQPRLFIGVGVRLIFGLQESTYLQQLSRLHMHSNLVFYYSIERSSSLLLYGSSLMWIPYQSRSQSLILYRDVFCQW